ncbi:hypothetical protein Hanom_Chr09g00803121 [Helianthus anomalus]
MEHHLYSKISHLSHPNIIKIQNYITIINIFFERLTNSPNGLLRKLTTSGYTRLQTGENPHLGLKPVNTRPKARQCGEVKPAQFKNRTSDLRLFA